MPQLAEYGQGIGTVAAAATPLAEGAYLYVFCGIAINGVNDIQGGDADAKDVGHAKDRKNLGFGFVSRASFQYRQGHIGDVEGIDDQPHQDHVYEIHGVAGVIIQAREPGHVPGIGHPDEGQ